MHSGRTTASRGGRPTSETNDGASCACGAIVAIGIVGRLEADSKRPQYYRHAVRV